MRLATGNQTSNRVAQPGGHDKPKNFDELCRAHENENRSLSENHSPQSSDYFQIVARATHDAVRDFDVSSGRLSWPHGLKELLGYDAGSTIADISFWNEGVHPEDRVRVAASIREALSAKGEHWSGEYRFRRADGNYVHLLERALIERDPEGKALRFVGSLMDITARKQLQDQLCRSQKMEAFGQLAGGVAHDFNNFLTTILGYSDLVLGETGVKGAVASHVTEIRKAAGRASVLAGQLLAFSRKQALELHVIEVNSFITNLERSLLPLLGDNITVACRLHREKEGVHIKVDPGQLTQIILNLAVNARDAMSANRTDSSRGEPDGGRLTLETSTVTLKEDRQSLPGLEELAAGDYVVISVIDNGSGMTDEVKAHLFEPFFTTKDDRRGSGLGLATSYGIVRQSGGRIRIESKVGTGTAVQIYLPKVPAPPAPPYKKPSSKKLPAGTETILVLEDDISVRHISVRALRKLGYEVIEAANGDDAQRLISESAARKIHLLLTDVVMPQMSGRYFADWLRKVSPRTKVVFVSGYLKESLQPGDRIDNGMFFLPKPFDQEQLATTIRQALDS
jgi:two-component system cell cycle sensor histidine kinase/response regulator CckA